MRIRRGEGFDSFGGAGGRCSSARGSEADRLSWLHSLSTQDLEHLEPGQSAETLILSPQGHIEHHLALTDDGDALWAHVEPGTAGTLLAFLESMRFMLRVEPADVTDDYAVLTVTRALPADSLPEGVSAALRGAVGTKT